ncbi:MAG: ECF transporter S component [Bifidobacterium mongoliense]|nr:ECF transporter S component [Bifidobacterium mongoliense]MDN6051211.1 ECF transporter S component [Bifidobacterium mongoliense]
MVIAVASGVVFWAVDLIYQPVASVFQVVPGLSSLLDGLYYFAGPLAILIVRKPGAALFAELIAAFVEAMMGSQWGGMGTLIPGLVQGLGAELAFLFFAYRVWNIGTAMLSGALAGSAVCSSRGRSSTRAPRRATWASPSSAASSPA